MHTASFRRAAGAVGLGALAAGLIAVPTPATANPSGTDLVISEVYGGGGGSTGSPSYLHDFIELHNPTAAPVSLTGWSVQYKSSTGANAQVAGLSGSIPPGGHFLIQSGSAGSVPATPAVPDPDAVIDLNLSQSGGVVFLARSTTAITARGDVEGVSDGGLVDTVGYGTSADTYETSRTGVALTNTTSAARAAGADSDDNAADFVEGAPDPQGAGGGVVDPPEPTRRTIAEIQGTGAASPLEGQQAITQGVVTAAYPTGGFDGFYIQTGGEDSTPGASDAIFVYEPGFTDIAVGDSVEVEGVVKEYFGLTELDATRVSKLGTSLPAVVPNSQLPGTDCALPGSGCLGESELDTLREELEGEAFMPTGPMTVTDAYDFGATSSNFYGEIGIAADSEIPLMTPTEVVDAQDASGIADRTAYNAAHLVVLDDGSSATYWNTRNTAGAQDDPVPWLTADHTVRVGAGVTFDQPVILDFRFGWKLQPQRQVVGVPTGLVTFEQDRPAAPRPVGGDLRLATFNVLNYFTTLGADVPGCTAYVDRVDDPVATNRCPGDNGPRGAWEPEDLERQQVKIVAAINAIDADVVSLEELENSLVVDGHDRDEALAALVAALNADAGTQRWAHVPSPDDLPDGEDVIRTGFIYDPSTVAAVGPGRILDHPAFDDAREPLAQAFRRIGGGQRTTFVVVANHFKSKGCGGVSEPADEDSGQGCWNPLRVAQADALTDFAGGYARARHTEAVFLTGDFNAYSEEDPVQAIEDAGYTRLESDDSSVDASYSFAGMSGSLDHVFASPAALDLVTGVDVWEINANESVFYQYSRHNYVGTDLYRPGAFASSDHNPEIVGIRAPHAGRR